MENKVLCMFLASLDMAITLKNLTKSHHGKANFCCQFSNCTDKPTLPKNDLKYLKCTALLI